jgi:hypothetical protein
MCEPVPRNSLRFPPISIPRHRRSAASPPQAPGLQARPEQWCSSARSRLAPILAPALDRVSKIGFDLPKQQWLSVPSCN